MRAAIIRASLSTRFPVPRTLDRGFAFIDNLHSQGRLLDNQEYRGLRKEVVLDYIRPVLPRMRGAQTPDYG